MEIKADAVKWLKTLMILDQHPEDLRRCGLMLVNVKLFLVEVRRTMFQTGGVNPLLLSRNLEPAFASSKC